MRWPLLVFAAVLPSLGFVACGDDAAPPSGAGPAADASPVFDATLRPDGGADARPDADTPETAGDASDAADAADAHDGSLDRPPQCGDTIPALRLTEVPIPGATAPLMPAFPPGDPTRAMIVEWHGTVDLLKGGVLTTFLDISSKVINSDDPGLLGFAFHPAYAQNGRFFVFYSALNRDLTIEEYKRSAADPDKADPTPVATLIVQPHPQANHNGGMLAFGPDGYLYVSMGDGGGAADRDPMYPHADGGNGQYLGTRLGKILRIDVDTRAAPPGNMTGAGVDPLIWDYGFRNPWRFSFDRKTGELYIGDVGENDWEEIDVEPPGAGRRNYGWSLMEGTHCFYLNPCDDAGGLTLPVIERPRAVAHSITGGYVYRGKKIPCLRGRYVYGDFFTKRFWTFTYDGAKATLDTELTSDLNPDGTLDLPVTSFGEDNDGELYFVTLLGKKMYRIDPE
jgi:glucose/arabinose dehydrogenase